MKIKDFAWNLVLKLEPQAIDDRGVVDEVAEMVGDYERELFEALIELTLAGAKDASPARAAAFEDMAEALREELTRRAL
jgi:hypothetical protein